MAINLPEAGEQALQFEAAPPVPQFQAAAQEMIILTLAQQDVEAAAL